MLCGPCAESPIPTRWWGPWAEPSVSRTATPPDTGSFSPPGTGALAGAPSAHAPRGHGRKPQATGGSSGPFSCPETGAGGVASGRHRRAGGTSDGLHTGQRRTSLRRNKPSCDVICAPLRGPARGHLQDGSSQSECLLGCNPLFRRLPFRARVKVSGGANVSESGSPNVPSVSFGTGKPPLPSGGNVLEPEQTLTAQNACYRKRNEEQNRAERRAGRAHNGHF